jgi:hypothetical protein
MIADRFGRPKSYRREVRGTSDTGHKAEPERPPFSAISGPSAPQQAAFLLGGLPSLHNPRHVDCKGRTTTGLALDGNITAHHLTKAAADHETKAGAPIFTGCSGRGLGKLLEQPAHLLRCWALSCLRVPQCETDCLAGLRGFELPEDDSSNSHRLPEKGTHNVSSLHANSAGLSVRLTNAIWRFESSDFCHPARFPRQPHDPTEFMQCCLGQDSGAAAHAAIRRTSSRRRRAAQNALPLRCPGTRAWHAGTPAPIRRCLRVEHRT